MGAHRYPEEFRREAVELYRSSDRPCRRVAESLGISDGSLVAWIAEFTERDTPGAPSSDERAVRLRKELAVVKEEREILRKGAQYFARDDPVTRCWFVDDHRADHDITMLCRLVELPRSTFYRWANPTLSTQLVDDAYLANDIVDIYRRSRGTYGSPRVWGQLRRAGIRVGQKRVVRLIAELKLVGAHSRRSGGEAAPTPHRPPTYWNGTSPRLRQIFAGSPTSRSSNVSTGNCSWPGFSTCMTGVSAAGRWANAKPPTSSSTPSSWRSRDVTQTLILSITPTEAAYTSLEFSNRLADWGVAASYGSTGDCFDNAAME